MPASPLLALGASDFVQLTTFRRSGHAVPTPVWVVPDGVVPVEARATTTADPGEVERVTRMLADKYGLQFKAFMLIEKVIARGERRREVIHLHPAEADGPGTTS